MEHLIILSTYILLILHCMNFLGFPLVNDLPALKPLRQDRDPDFAPVLYNVYRNWCSAVQCLTYVADLAFSREETLR